MGSQGEGVLLQLKLLSVVLAAMAAPAAAQAKPDCRDRCGDVTIPYPFGITQGCYLSDEFSIQCDTTKPRHQPIYTGNLTVKNITLDGELQVWNLVSYACYSPKGIQLSSSSSLIWLSKFSISGTRNKFVGIGCNPQAYLEGSQGEDWYTTTCDPGCSGEKQANDRNYSDACCCEGCIPRKSTSIHPYFKKLSDCEDVQEFKGCGYAFVVQRTTFNCYSKDLTNIHKDEKLPLVIDWSIGNQTCKEAEENQTTYACKENSECYEPRSRSGYLCRCSEGYRGNPYLPPGCQKDAECPDPNPCIKKDTCKYTQGIHTCSCPKGYHGDGKKKGQGCHLNESLLIPIALGSGIILFLGCSWLYWGLRQQRFIKLKEKFFQQNGGLMLQQQLSKGQGSTQRIKIFTAEELDKATQKYDESRIIGRGGYGIVYKGILSEDTTVAIKKSRIADKTQIQQFINEVLVLSQINHRNVVQLLGCCLETEVPLLVYEYITNGTLHDHIHHHSKASAMPWEIRLKIAAETAGVLSYLHSAASTPIIHRDVKSANILLDENFTAKVSDFGASRLVPIDQTQLSTLVQGTLGYLDPEYLHSSQLTEKSDVYSFGVVLVELLTEKKALAFDRPEEERSLASYFLIALKEDRLFQVVGNYIIDEGKQEQIMKVAQLAKRCLNVKGDDRPTMKEVAMELEGMRMMLLNLKAIKDLHGEPSIHYYGSSSNPTATDDSMKDQVILPVSDGR